MKRTSDTLFTRQPCDECGAAADMPCASWCLGRVQDEDESEDVADLESEPATRQTEDASY